MIEEHAGGLFRVTCEGCGNTEDHEADLRESVVLRLLRARWRVRSGSGTWCPGCSGHFGADEAPTSRMRPRL